MPSFDLDCGGGDDVSSDTTELAADDDLDADSLSIEPVTSVISTHPNNESTFPLFRFKRNAQKTIKAENVTRTYYVCNMHKQTKCAAKRLVDVSLSNKDSKVATYKEEHNHGPLSNPKIRPEVKQSAILQMSAGASAVNVHKQAVNGASLPLSSADVPSKSQLKNWKYRDAMKDMPTSVCFLYYLFFLSNSYFLQMMCCRTSC